MRELKKKKVWREWVGVEMKERKKKKKKVGEIRTCSREKRKGSFFETVGCYLFRPLSLFLTQLTE